MPAAVDPKKRFVDLVVGWPGSVNDARIWSTSQLYHDIENLLQQLPSTPITTFNGQTTQIENLPAFILGDSAYVSSNKMVPTYRVTECSSCPITKALNRKLSSIRYCVENAFGICKGRFQILNRPMECAADDVRRAVILITAAFTLHNFLIDEKDQSVVEVAQRLESDIGDVVDVDEVRDNAEMAARTGLKPRDILWRHMAWINAGEDPD